MNDTDSATRLDTLRQEYADAARRLAGYVASAADDGGHLRDLDAHGPNIARYVREFRTAEEAYLEGIDA